MNPLTIALPKGRLLEPTARLFRHLGWRCDLGNGSRQLLVTETNNDPIPGATLRFLLAKPADVPVYVEYGAADLGVVSQDVLWESERDVYEPLPLGFGRCRLVVAGPPSQQNRNIRLAAGLRVATQYPRHENGLLVFEEVVTCQATLIVNRVAHRLRLIEIRQLLSTLKTAKVSVQVRL